MAELLYHHSRSIKGVSYGEVNADPQYTDPLGFKGAYDWLAGEVGFYPLFLAVGSTKTDLKMTTYDDEEENVLFSFGDVEGSLMDFDYWHIALSEGEGPRVNRLQKRWIFKPSWSKARWLRKVKKEPGHVQLVTPKLHLPNAKRIWVHNERAKRRMEELGFRNVEIRQHI